MYWKIHSQNETVTVFEFYYPPPLLPSLGQSADPFLNAREEDHGPGELAGWLRLRGRMQGMSLFWYRREGNVRMGWMKSKHRYSLVEIWNYVGVSLQLKTVYPTYIMLICYMWIKLHTHCFLKKRKKEQRYP